MLIIFQHLYREMRIWATLSHPNIVALLGHTTDPGAPALISPFYENGCVLDYLERYPSANRNDIVRFIFLLGGLSDFGVKCADVAAGLSCLHSHDPPIIHGDIKGVREMF